MWSFGCTIAELFISKDTLFTDGAQDGMLSSDLVLLASITSILGTPTSETWPESTITKKSINKLAMNFRDWDKVQLSVKPPLPKKDVLPWASQGMRDWIFSMIAISAGERASASRVKFPCYTINGRPWIKEHGLFTCELFRISIGIYYILIYNVITTYRHHYHRRMPQGHHQYPSPAKLVSEFHWLYSLVPSSFVDSLQYPDYSTY